MLYSKETSIFREPYAVLIQMLYNGANTQCLIYKEANHVWGVISGAGKVNV